MNKRIKIVLLLLIFVLFLIAQCKKTDEQNRMIEKSKNGMLIITNPSPQKKDKIILELTNTLSIDSGSVIDDIGAIFSDFEKDKSGNIYLLDGSNVVIYIFNKSGERISSIRKKGNGPGEFMRYPKLQISNGFLWLTGDRKIAKFENNGKFVKEFKLKNYFTSITLIDDENFIGTKEMPVPGIKKKKLTKKMLGLFSLISEELIYKYFDSKMTGRFTVKIGNKPLSVIPDPGVVPDVVFSFNKNNGNVVFSECDSYNVFIKNKMNRVVSHFSFDLKNSILTNVDKKNIIEEFGSLPPQLEKLIMKKLPDNFASIKKIYILSNNNILIEHERSLHESDFTLFDEIGHFKTRINFNLSFHPDLIKFYKEKICILEKSEVNTVYHEYKVLSDIDLF